MADPTDRTSMDDLTDALDPFAKFTASDGFPGLRVREKQEMVEALLTFLRERGLLLGPDGLLQADRTPYFSLYDPPTPLFALSPLDPPEDT